jgi:hypothetical protein
MIITAYSVIRSADVTEGYAAIYGVSPDYAAAGTRIYADPMFSDFIEESNGAAWVYTDALPTTTDIPDFPGLQTYAAVTKGPLTTYALAHYENITWYFHNGQFYRDDAPEGAYQLTDLEHTTLINLMNQGKSLGWYANQRPYIYSNWTHPDYGSNDSNSDGALFSASSEYTYSHAYMAVDNRISSTDIYEWRPNAAGPAWWQVTFPFKIMLTGLIHHNCARTGSQIGGHSGIQGQYFADANGEVSIGPFFNSGGNPLPPYSVYSSDLPIITHIIRLEKIASTEGYTDRGDAGVKEVEITASKIIYEVGER